MTTLLQTFVASQVSCSRFFDDNCLPPDYVVDGNREYLDEIAPGYLRPGAVIWDIGGGKNPLVDLETKRRLGLRIVGLDISRSELEQAPAGVYDDTVCCDIGKYTLGRGDADLVYSQAVLEHVSDTGAALEAIERILKPGGRAVLFVPARNALYARLNLILPEGLKRGLLFSIYPATRRNHGFPAYYDRCTPGDFRRMARELGLEVEELYTYHCSGYFRCFFPVHLLWRLWLITFRAIAAEQSAETFTIILRKPGGAR